MKVDMELVWGLGGLMLGIWMAKRAAEQAAAKPTTPNQVTTTGQWWTYAGMWA